MTAVPLVPGALLGAAPDARLAAGTPDAPLAAGGAPGDTFARGLAVAMSDVRSRLGRADRAEAAFVHGRGSLQAMVVERAQADVALSLATAAASRVTQSLTTILGMQV